MKTAQTTDGKKIDASPQSPKAAICPYCGGELTLRSRRAMNSEEISYFWRHHSNKNRDCVARRRPVA